LSLVVAAAPLPPLEAMRAKTALQLDLILAARLVAPRLPVRGDRPLKNSPARGMAGVAAMAGRPLLWGLPVRVVAVAGFGVAAQAAAVVVGVAVRASSRLAVRPALIKRRRRR
jgi:hypothetical protein